MVRRAPTLLVGSSTLAALVTARTEPLCDLAPPPLRSGVFEVSREDLAGRSRVGGRPGDLGLRNHAVTAVVRRRDGVLVDFWRNQPAPATAPQLGEEDRVDGIWTLHQALRDGRGSVPFTSHSVERDDASIVTRSRVATLTGPVEVTTRYSLEGDHPRLVLETELRAVTATVTGAALQDLVKWGNVAYVVDGVTPRRSSFSGRASWVGRRGAGGDLRLLTLEETPLSVDYQLLEVQSAPTIHVTHPSGPLVPGTPRRARRVLEYTSFDPPPARRGPEDGELRVTITDEHGAPLPSKLTVRGVAPTRDPDFGRDGGLDGAGRFVWSGNGVFRRALPPGRYRLLGSGGFERELWHADVEIRTAAVSELSGVLPRAFETPGWVSADLHLHQVASVDADIGRRERLVSVAAEGVEVAVASDHFVADDLGPAERELRASGHLARPVVTVIGTELSTTGNLFGHFNLFPLDHVDVADRVDASDTTPKELFARARAAAPEALLQVNHPRWSQIGYFHRYRMDPATARVPHPGSQEYDPGFDALEVANGLDAVSEPKLRQVLRDWMNLLGRGHRYVATGNSDSHKLFIVDPGVPRNFVRWREDAAPGSDAQDVEVSPTELARALRAGRNVVSSGPFLDVTVNGVGPGGTVRGGTRHLVKIRLLAASWVDVQTVEVLLGGPGHRVRFLDVSAARGVVRLEAEVPVTVDGPTFVVVLARGTRALPTTWLPVRPFAFTNPIFLEP